LKSDPFFKDPVCTRMKFNKDLERIT